MDGMIVKDYISATPWDVPDSQAEVVQIPVTLLRWTHDNVEQFLNFRHGDNNEVLPPEDRHVIYSTFDLLFVPQGIINSGQGVLS